MAQVNENLCINRRLFIVCNKYIDNPLFAYWAFDEKEVKDHLKKTIGKKFWEEIYEEDIACGDMSKSELNKMASNISYFYEQWWPLIVNEYYLEGKNGEYLYVEDYSSDDPRAENNKNSHDRTLKWKKITISDQETKMRDQETQKGIKIETLN